MTNEKDSEIIENDFDFSEDSFEEGAAFSKSIRQVIRRAFIKAGVVILIVLLAILLFIQFALPSIVSAFYYDPGETIEYIDPDDPSATLEEDQMNVDLNVYTELKNPVAKRNTVSIEARGYGVYDIEILQTVKISNSFGEIGDGIGDVAGVIRRGKLTLYNLNLLRNLAITQFAAVDNSTYNTGDGGGEASWFEDAKNSFIEGLDDLEEQEYRMVAVSYSQPLRYDEIVAIEDRYDAHSWWQAVQLADEEDWELVQNRGIMGYESSYSGTHLRYHEDKYPYLTGDETVDEDFSRFDESQMTQHFLSMLKYMIDHKDFQKMMDEKRPPTDYQGAHDYVSEHGLHIYGSVFYADKETLKKISQDERISRIDYFQ